LIKIFNLEDHSWNALKISKYACAVSIK